MILGICSFLQLSAKSFILRALDPTRALFSGRDMGHAEISYTLNCSSANIYLCLNARRDSKSALRYFNYTLEEKDCFQCGQLTY